MAFYAATVEGDRGLFLSLTPFRQIQITKFGDGEIGLPRPSRVFALLDLSEESQGFIALNVGRQGDPCRPMVKRLRCPLRCVWTT